MNVWLYLVLLGVSIANFVSAGAGSHCQPFDPTFEAQFSGTHKMGVSDCWCLVVNTNYTSQFPKDVFPAPMNRSAPPYAALEEWCTVYRSQGNASGTVVYNKNTYLWWGKTTIGSPWDVT